MRPLFLLPITLFSYISAQGNDCCQVKTVGMYKYYYYGIDYMAYDYGCSSPCIYMMEGNYDSKYCFKPGVKNSVCDVPGMGGGYGGGYGGGMGGGSGGGYGGGGMGGGSGGNVTAAPSPGGGGDGSGVDDEVTTRVKGFIDAGTCNAVSFGDYSDAECGDSGTSYYKEFIYNNKRVQVSNNIPDHAAESDMIAPNPNIRCPGWQFIELPIDPEKGTSFTDTTLGTIGLAVTGGAFFNDLSNPDGSLALTNEGPSLDTCLGHSAPTNMGGGGGGMGPPPGGPGGNGPPPGRYKRQEDTPHAGQYHYHGNINCTNAGAATGANDPDMCKLIGYYRDGVPVYGFCKDSNGMVFTSCYKLNSGASTSTVVTASGTYNIGATTSDYTFTADSSCNLDEANGAMHPTTGKYSYFMTTDYPWTPRKYGTTATASYCSAAAA